MTIIILTVAGFVLFWLGYMIGAVMAAGKYADIAMGIECDERSLARRSAEDAAREAMGWTGHD